MTAATKVAETATFHMRGNSIFIPSTQWYSVLVLVILQFFNWELGFWSSLWLLGKVLGLDIFCLQLLTLSIPLQNSFSVLSHNLLPFFL